MRDCNCKYLVTQTHVCLQDLVNHNTANRSMPIIADFVHRSDSPCRRVIAVVTPTVFQHRHLKFLTPRKLPFTFCYYSLFATPVVLATSSACIHSHSQDLQYVRLKPWCPSFETCHKLRSNLDTKRQGILRQENRTWQEQKPPVRSCNRQEDEKILLWRLIIVQEVKLSTRVAARDETDLSRVSTQGFMLSLYGSFAFKMRQLISIGTCEQRAASYRQYGIIDVDFSCQWAKGRGSSRAKHEVRGGLPVRGV